MDVTGTDKAINTVSSSSTNSSGARTHTVSGLTDTQTYNIELHEAEDVVVDDTGDAFYANNNPLTTGATSIEVVNGASVGSAGGTNTYTVDDVQPVNGSITFTVDSTVADTVQPVVYVDADNDGTLVPTLPRPLPRRPRRTMVLVARRNGSRLRAPTPLRTRTSTSTR